jgi:hypothetical protein
MELQTVEVAQRRLSICPVGAAAAWNNIAGGMPVEATYISQQKLSHVADLWSNPDNWADGGVPSSSVDLDVLYTGIGYNAVDLGTAQDPFLTHNVTAETSGLGVDGFLSTYDIEGKSVVVEGSLLVRNDASADIITLGGAGTTEIEHNFAKAGFMFQGINESPFGDAARDATLILDRPPPGSIDNGVVFQTNRYNVTGSGKIELGGLVFDHADLLPAVPGTGPSTIQLTNHGCPVYQLTNVSQALWNGETTVFSGSLSVGTDSENGYHFVAYDTPPG